MERERKKAGQSEQAQKVVQMYQDGVSVDDIRGKLHIGVERMYKALQNAGVTMRVRGGGRGHGRGGPQQETASEKLKQAVAMYVAGEYLQTIKRRLHISERSLHEALRVEGVALRYGNEHRNRAFGEPRPKRTKRAKQTTTNIVMLQQSYGEDFVGLANRVLAGELAFQI